MLLAALVLALSVWWLQDGSEQAEIALRETGMVVESAPSVSIPVKPEVEPDLSGVKLVIDPPAAARAHAASSPQPESPAAVATPASVSSEVAPEVAAPEPAPDPWANTPYLRQLPVEVQRALPALNFSVHIYSDTPAARMVKLEDRVLREGQRVAPELDVVAIIPRAVVLRYRDQPFKVPAL
jgi:general secretion pathway protein B